MLLSDLLDTPVIDSTGNKIGHIVDVLLVQDGPIVGGFGAQPRVEGIAIGKQNLAVRLGYHRADVKGPAPLRFVLDRLALRTRYADWADVASVEESEVRLRVAGGDLSPPPVV